MRRKFTCIFTAEAPFPLLLVISICAGGAGLLCLCGLAAATYALIKTFCRRRPIHDSSSYAVIIVIIFLMILYCTLIPEILRQLTFKKLEFALCELKVTEFSYVVSRSYTLVPKKTSVNY